VSKSIPKTYMSMDCCKCGIFEKIFTVNHAQTNACLFRQAIVSAQDRTGDLAPLHYGNPNAERSSAMANSYPDVDVLRGRKLLDR
jgi:hypothetical protein